MSRRKLGGDCVRREEGRKSGKEAKEIRGSKEAGTIKVAAGGGGGIQRRN